MKKFLKFLLFLIIIAMVLFLVSKNYTSRIIKKSVSKLESMNNTDMRVVLNTTKIYEDGRKEEQTTERLYYQGDFVSKGSEQIAIYYDSHDKLLLINSGNNSEKETKYIVTSHFYFQNLNYLPLLYSNAEELYSWDDEMPVIMNLAKLLYSPSFTKSAEENGKSYYVLKANGVGAGEYWIDKSDYTLYKYIEKDQTTVYETQEKYHTETIYHYDKNVTSESVEWPDLSGKDVIFM